MRPLTQLPASGPLRLIHARAVLQSVPPPRRCWHRDRLLLRIAATRSSRAAAFLTVSIGTGRRVRRKRRAPSRRVCRRGRSCVRWQPAEVAARLLCVRRLLWTNGVELSSPALALALALIRSCHRRRHGCVPEFPQPQGRDRRRERIRQAISTHLLSLYGLWFWVLLLSACVCAPYACFRAGLLPHSVGRWVGLVHSRPCLPYQSNHP